MAEQAAAAPVKKSEQDEQVLQIIILYFKLVALLSVVWILGYFQFSITWVLIILLVYVFNSYYKRMKDKQMQMAHDAAKNEQKSVLARLESLPSWVVFPDVERTEWVNKVISQMWPFIGDYVEELLKTSIEGKLKASLPSSLKSFKFERVDLGDIAPRIGGVKVYVDHVRRDEIVLDMELFYAGDADIRVSIGRGKAGIKDVQVHGTLRVIMSPLMSKIPLVGGLQVFFLSKPTIDFNLTDLANALDIPGLSDSLHAIIRDQVASLMVLPNRLPVQLSGDVSYADLKYPMPKGVLRINLVQAADLKAADVNVFKKNSSDPYALIFVGSNTFRTKTINGDVNPFWNEFYEAVVDQKTGQNVDIEVYDDDNASKDDDLGSVSIDVASIVNKKNMDKWLRLEEADEGQIRIKLMWLNLSSNPQDLHKADLMNSDWFNFTRNSHPVNDEDSVSQARHLNSAEALSTALLMVYLDSASDLPSHRRSLTSEPSPYCKLAVGNTELTSRVEANTANPRWEQNFQFLIHSPTLENLELQVCDSKQDKKLGWCSMSISQLLAEPSMCIYEPVALKHAGPQSKVVVRLCLRILTSEVDANSSPIMSSVSEPSPRPSTSHNESQPTSNDTAPSGGKPVDLVDAVLDNGIDKVPVENIESDSGSNTPTMLEKVGQELRKRTTTSQVGSEGKGEGLGQIQVTIRYSAQRSRLIVVVHKCRYLTPMDEEGVADPYVRLYLLPDKSLHGKKKTQVSKNTLNPEFDETFEFAVNRKEAVERSLDFAVKNQTGFFSKEKTDMGRVEIELCSIDLNKAVTQWYDLHHEDKDPNKSTVSRSSSVMTTV